jgi:hypothetical protein
MKYHLREKVPLQMMIAYAVKKSIHSPQNYKMETSDFPCTVGHRGQKEERGKDYFPSL